MTRYRRILENETRMPRDNMNGIMDGLEKVLGLTVGPGLVLSNGPSGMALALDDSFRIAIVKMGVSSGSYPTYENDRYVFPARLAMAPKFDSSDPDLAHTEVALEAPAINVYNLAKCWLFENEYHLAVQINGGWWTYCRRPMLATANASITKGSTGTCTTVRGTTIAITDCRAKFGATVSGNDLWIEHDGVEWVIGAEECA